MSAREEFGPRRIISFLGEPLTRREAELAREAFRAGAEFRQNYCPCGGFAHLACDVTGEAKARFPLPAVTRPLRVTMSTGAVWSFQPKGEGFKNDCFAEHRASGTVYCWPSYFFGRLHTPADVILAGRICSGETETVEEPG